jgi:hypothetical protein
MKEELYYDPDKDGLIVKDKKLEIYLKKQDKLLGTKIWAITYRVEEDGNFLLIELDNGSQIEILFDQEDGTLEIQSD